MKKLLALLLTFALALAFVPAALAEGEVEAGDIVILYTNDVHCSVEQEAADDGTVSNMGYAGVAAYKADMKAITSNVALVDCGDAIQGEAIGTLSKGRYLIDIMNEIGYDYAVYGNHEFDYGMSRIQELTAAAKKFNYLSCNFMDIKSDPAKTVLDAYAIRDFVGGKKVAFVGISTPESITKSTPAYFQDEDGNYIYGFCSGGNGQELYDAVQAAVDAAKAEGVDYVVAIAHLGIDTQSSPWTSREVIANTTGIDVVLDGHSHSIIAGETVKNKEGKDVILSSTGDKLRNLGRLVIKADGTMTTSLIAAADYTKKDVAMDAYIASINEQYRELLNAIVAKTDVALTVNDPETAKRMVRNRETNLGDLCADAYRTLLDADIAFVNGGGIRDVIPKGDITYGQIINVHPFGNMACSIEVTGQQILDALELGCASTPGESGGFLQVSGLTYEIHTYIPSGVQLDENKMFQGVEGERRVKNVKVGGVPIDVNKTYVLASHNYMLKAGGDGFSMFKGAKVLRDEVMIDNQVLINYIQDELKGVVGSEYANPYGQGRIKLVAEKPAEQPEEQPEEPDYSGVESGSGIAVDGQQPVAPADPTPPQTGAAAVTGYAILSLVSGAGIALYTKKKSA